MADVSKIKLPNGTTYDIKDENALPLTGGSVTGPVSFGDSVSIDEATVGDLVVNGSASFTNNLQANTINGVTVGSNPKFTDTNTVTTATTTGSGNAVTAVTASNGALTITKGTTFLTAHNTYTISNSGSGNAVTGVSLSGTTFTVTKGTTFLTSHQDISGKADKATTLAGYGITDAKIASGVITLGSNTITPLTSSSTLSAAKLSGAIPSAVTATTQASTDNSTKIATTAYVTTAIANLPEPMVFKGSVGTGGTVTSLPTAAASNEGWTYKVITALSSPAAKVGDTVISNGSSWVVIPSGDEPSGTVTSVGISNGGGLSVSGSPITSSGTITISHADTSSQASSSNSGRTYIQSLTLDTYGHVTGISTATETVTNTDEKLAVGGITSGSTYYPIVSSDTIAATTKQIDWTGFSYDATTSKTGYARITLGNSTAQPISGSKYGALRLYGTATNSTTIVSGAPTAIRTVTLPDKSGTIALTDDIPDVSGKIDTAGTGLSKSGTTLNHSNNITAQTTQAVYPIKIDKNGHISAYGSAVTIPTIPSNNVTGSGTNNYLAIWSGTNTLSTEVLHTSSSYNTSSDLYGTIKLYLGYTGQIDWKGQLVFYSGGSNAITITPSSLTDDRTIVLPNKTGTIALTSDIPTVPSNIVNTITTTAGAHTAISSQKGNVSFNVPTKTSHLTNDSGFITTDTKVSTNLAIDLQIYYPVLGTDTTSASTKNYDKGFMYLTESGTTSDTGEASLTLGNNTASGTAGNKKGTLTLYGSSAYGVILESGAPTATRTITLPDKSGTVILNTDVLDVGNIKLNTLSVPCIITPGQYINLPRFTNSTSYANASIFAGQTSTTATITYPGSGFIQIIDVIARDSTGERVIVDWTPSAAQSNQNITVNISIAQSYTYTIECLVLYRQMFGM